MPRPEDLPESNHYATVDPNILSREYTWLWSQLSVPTSKGTEASRAATVAVANKARYQTVSSATGAPWYFIAAIHYREASQSWKGCLHNGDRWDMVTVHVPSGLGPWQSWEDAAIDAIQREGYANLLDWSCGALFRRLEFYNGKGYRVGGVKNFVCRKQGNRIGTFDGIYKGSMQDTTPRNASPYIYNGTPFYRKGISIEDHSFYPDAIDDNVGVMLFLKVLEGVAGESFFQAATGDVVEFIGAPEEDIASTLSSLADSVGVPRSVIEDMYSLQQVVHPGKFPRFWAACNFKERSDQKRFHVFDRIAKTVVSMLCAHGQGSEPDHDGLAKIFSNIPNSNQSSLGIFRCSETYMGKHGLSLRIDGLEPSNSNARERSVVIHSAGYVSEELALKYKRVGCSNGCFAFSESDATNVIQQLEGGSLLAAYF
ncbi:murein L,D-transpeptidase catalytic domain-containing protein [Oryzibacter oryziterrae]|uniref:murein L,D-transpeptidase catalytic domain-containing protein n=1 Tax=Oryzibacter oryziterrae TaxID=2766474 RepID=UPI001F26B071|nr:murein L,D-transpeptidase catalytic domain family protein [Oryzibacter oryziterrae]